MGVPDGDGVGESDGVGLGEPTQATVKVKEHFAFAAGITSFIPTGTGEVVLIATFGDGVGVGRVDEGCLTK
jgi:hypothetical protein